MGFFTGFFAFIFVLVFLGWMVKYPSLAIVLLFIVVFAIMVNYQNSKDRDEAAKQGIEHIRQELEKISFKVSKEIYLTRDRAPHGLVYSEIIIDSHNQQIAVCDFLKTDLKLIPFQKLVNCEVVENDETVQSFIGTSQKDSKLVIGGMPAKEISPIVNNLSIKIETLNSDNSEISVITVPIITTPIRRKEYDYKKARDIANDAYFSLIKILKDPSSTLPRKH